MIHTTPDPGALEILDLNFNNNNVFLLMLLQQMIHIQLQWSGI